MSRIVAALAAPWPVAIALAALLQVALPSAGTVW